MHPQAWPAQWTLHMSLLTPSLLFWAIAAVLVFWALGAYNRLIRLRSHMLQHLQGLLLQWQAQAQAMRQELAQLSRVAEPDMAEIHSGHAVGNWQPLALAAKQFQTCIAGRLAQPHAVPGTDDLAAVRAAHGVMHSAWQRLQGTQDDLAGAAVPQSLALLWQHHAVLAQNQQREYNASVQCYNQAIQQFPARLLAWIFSFQAAQAT